MDRSFASGSITAREEAMLIQIPNFVMIVHEIGVHKDLGCCKYALLLCCCLGYQRESTRKA